MIFLSHLKKYWKIRCAFERKSELENGSQLIDFFSSRQLVWCDHSYVYSVRLINAQLFDREGKGIYNHIRRVWATKPALSHRHVYLLNS